MTRPLSHWLLLLALVAMWGSAFMMTGVAVRGFTPATLVAIRLVIAAALLGGLVLLSGRRFPVSRQFWLFSLAISLAGNCVPFWLISFGQQRIDSGLAGILMGIMPLTTMVLAHFFVRGERLNRAKASGFLLGFVGLVVLIGPDALLQLRGEGTALLYQLAVLGGAICYAVNTIIARHRPPADPLVAAAGVMLMGSLVMLPIGGPAAPEQLASAPAVPFAAMIALALVATAIATVVFLKLVAVAGPSFTSFINYLIPVWALLMGVIFLGEEPQPTTLVALVLILAGIGLSEVGSRRMIRAEARQNA
ncbi:MAG TPA: DMT family transporter [Geminicoccaceae bacterium]|nr:DMT family transporter [Geminicoccaceae bacterium]